MKRRSLRGLWVTLERREAPSQGLPSVAPPLDRNMQPWSEPLFLQSTRDGGLWKLACTLPQR